MTAIFSNGEPGSNKTPSSRAWRPGRDVLARRMAERAAARGALWPRVAAAALIIRGLVGDDRDAFATRTGLSEHEIDALEDGRIAPTAIPACLRELEDVIDWLWVDADPGDRGDEQPG